MRALSSFSCIGLSAISMIVIMTMATGCAAIKLPGTSGASWKLQRDAAQALWMVDYIEDAECNNRKIIDTEISYDPEVPSSPPYPEMWTVNRCGEIVYYRVEFKPTPAVGGTDIHVALLDNK